MPPEIAALVAAHNEEERLGATLSALRATFPGARLIVADDGSTDRTPEIALEAGAELVRGERRLGKGGANTLAADQLLAGGTPAVVLLCDGDLGASAAALAPLVTRVADGAAEIAVAVFARRVGGGFGLALGFARWAVEKRAGRVLQAPLSGQRALTPGALIAVLPFAPGFGMETAMDIDALRAGFALRGDGARARASRHRPHRRRLPPPGPPAGRHRARVPVTALRGE